MRKFDSPYIADWFAISLRWMTLFVFSTFFVQVSDWFSFLPLIGLALWNLALSVMAGLNRRLSYHRQFVIVVDMLFAVMLFFLHGGLRGLFWGIVILPILSGAIYYEILGGLLNGGLIAALYMAYAYFAMTESALPLAGILSGSLLVLGLVFGFISSRMIGGLRITREDKQAAEKKRRHVENERLRAIYELTATLTATLSYRHVLEAALDLSVKSLNP